MNNAGILVVAGATAVGLFEIGQAAATHVRASRAGVKSMPDRWQFDGPGDYLIAVAAGTGALVYMAMAARPMVSSWVAALDPR